MEQRLKYCNPNSQPKSISINIRPSPALKNTCAKLISAFCGLTNSQKATEINKVLSEL